jgi:hypothetical protein
MVAILAVLGLGLLIFAYLSLVAWRLRSGARPGRARRRARPRRLPGIRRVRRYLLGER